MTNDEATEAVIRKFKSVKKNPDVYLEGLMYSKPITYWDYIQVDTLLSLQKTRTNLPDEEIFVMYHQVTELYFKMILSELKQIANHPYLRKSFLIPRIARINRYVGALTMTFDIMSEGMEVEQYLKFRNALTPASGFQSAQYRMIEICCTDLDQLVDPRQRKTIKESDTVEKKFQHLYWLAGGEHPKTGEKTLTLSLFEEKYGKVLLQHTNEFADKNLRKKYTALPKSERTDEELIFALRELDRKINIEWPLVHYNTAKKYLITKGETNKATGGSDWTKYLHPMYQKRIFFPELWSKEEIDNWAKQ